MEFSEFLAGRSPDASLAVAQEALRLVESGEGVPFVARYRTEAVAGLSEDALWALVDAKEEWDALRARQEFVLAEIARQGDVAAGIKEEVEATFDRAELDDRYLPYKRKRRSPAAIAREAGLGPLADWIWDCGQGTQTPLDGQTLELWAFTFRNEDAGVNDAAAAICGARDILVERLAEARELRRSSRALVRERASFLAVRSPRAKPGSRHERVFDQRQAVAPALAGEREAVGRVQAFRRATADGDVELRVDGGGEGADLGAELQPLFVAYACRVDGSPGDQVLREAAEEALRVHVLPAMLAEVQKALKAIADTATLREAVSDLRAVLLRPPLGRQSVLGVQAGLRTGAKAAVISADGSVLAHGMLAFRNESGRPQARSTLLEWITGHGVAAVAVGSGAGGREAQSFVRTVLLEEGKSLPVVLVDDVGAGAYANGEIGRGELPELDATSRAAASVGRRLQDPLAELVKIDPRQLVTTAGANDVPVHLLARELERAVTSCVHHVGVDVNLASESLLSRIGDIGPVLAATIVEHRRRHGAFTTRLGLLEVPHLDRRIWERSAPFLRVHGGEEPLDATGVPPSRYAAVGRAASALGVLARDLLGEAAATAVRECGELASELGEASFEALVIELARADRDPRGAYVPPAVRADVRSLEDLKPGMRLSGVVTSVTTFGAFVDVGLPQDGLVHVSRLSEAFVADARTMVRIGDVLDVRVNTVDREKGQISLSIDRGRPDGALRPDRRERSERGPRRGDRGAAAGRGGPGVSQGRRTDSDDAPGGSDTDRRRDRGPRPDRPPRQVQGGRPHPGSSREDRPHQGGGGRPGGRPAFNNPFAVLATLRSAPKRDG